MNVSNNVLPQLKCSVASFQNQVQKSSEELLMCSLIELVFKFNDFDR